MGWLSNNRLQEPQTRATRLPWWTGLHKKIPTPCKRIKELKHDLILDGEAVVLNGEGKPDFDALQKFNGQNSGVVFYAFDILWL